MASLNFYDQDYFEAAFLNYLDQGAVPDIDQLSYIAQSCAILRKGQYSDVLVAWLAQTINDCHDTLLTSSDLKKEQSFVSAL